LRIVNRLRGRLVGLKDSTFLVRPKKFVFEAVELHSGAASSEFQKELDVALKGCPCCIGGTEEPRDAACVALIHIELGVKVLFGLLSLAVFTLLLTFAIDDQVRDAESADARE